MTKQEFFETFSARERELLYNDFLRFLEENSAKIFFNEVALGEKEFYQKRLDIIRKFPVNGK